MRKYSMTSNYLTFKELMLLYEEWEHKINVF